MRENYDVYQIRMPKGQKEIIKAHAAAHNESVNSFISRAIVQTIQSDNVAAQTEITEQEPTSKSGGGCRSLLSRMAEQHDEQPPAERMQQLIQEMKGATGNG